MSPMGETFQMRLRMFPSLINCCTIDWFTNWPAEALVNVARGSIAEEADMNLNEDEEGVIEMFKVVHQSAEDAVQKFHEQMSRRCYVTPTSYLELLTTYKSILKKQRDYVSKSKRRLERGLKVLAMAATQVAELQEELKVKQPALVQKQEEIEVKKVVIAKDTEDADKIKVVVEVDKEIAQKDAAEVQAVKDHADKELGKALPMLDAAIKKVDQIDAKDFYELKGMGAPSPPVVACFKIIVLFFNGYNVKVAKPRDEKKMQYDPEGYFEKAKQDEKILNKPIEFLKGLKTYDRDNMPEELINKVKPLMEEEAMSEKKVGNASKALMNVRVWIVAMLTYYETLKIVNPMRETARVMTDRLNVVMAALKVKEDELQVINDKLDSLNAQLAESVAEATRLSDELEGCAKQLYRAQKMIVGLQGEKERWTETVARLGIQQQMITGDCLVASGMLVYSGPFISQYREDLEELWRSKIKEVGIKFTEMISMKKLLGVEVTTR